MRADPTGGRTARRGPDPFYIVAPVNHPDEVPALAEAGADEIYCGVLPPSWSERYGDWDCLSRRQGKVANLTGVGPLRRLAERAEREGLEASLALNVRYTREQLPDVLELARAWELAGGGSVVVSSLAVLIGLQQRGSALRRHVSLLANAANGQAVAFFRSLGASRVILPRELTVAEMAAVVSGQPGIQYEAMALNEKCRFIDGLCGFYHGTAYPDEGASFFSFRCEGPEGTPVVYSHDPGYAGHGCQVPFADERGRRIPQPRRDDVNRPACAACDLPALHRAGVRLLKIGGRGFPTELKRRAVSFLRRAGEMALCGAGPVEFRTLYRSRFGHDCGSAACYYAAGPREGD